MECTLCPLLGQKPGAEVQPESVRVAEYGRNEQILSLSTGIYIQAWLLAVRSRRERRVFREHWCVTWPPMSAHYNVEANIICLMLRWHVRFRNVDSGRRCGDHVLGTRYCTEIDGREASWTAQRYTTLPVCGGNSGQCFHSDGIRAFTDVRLHGHR
jgi:hypothetical protein